MNDAVNIEITEAELNTLLSPWTIRTHPIESDVWRGIRTAQTKRFRGKRFKRAVKSNLLAWFKPKKTGHRTPEFVRASYSPGWAQYHLPNPMDSANSKKTVYLEWKETGYETLVFARDRCHLLGIAKVLEQLQPSSVLEIGSGPGTNLIALSAMFPDVEFSGVELTSTGVEAAKSVQSVALPDVIEQIAPLPVKSRTAHQRISFQEGDARSLPFPDNHFDIVFTRLAIEQMEQIRQEALAEMHRVVKSHAIFVEPLRDFNSDPLQQLATQTKNYISLNVKDLSEYGFEPIFQFAAWPHKITNGAGLIVCRKIDF